MSPSLNHPQSCLWDCGFALLFLRNDRGERNAQTDQQRGDVFHRRKRSLDPRGEGGEDGWRFCRFVLSERLRLVTPASKQTVSIQRSSAEQHPEAKEENRVVALEVGCFELGYLPLRKMTADSPESRQNTSFLSKNYELSAIYITSRLTNYVGNDIVKSA